MNEHKQYDQTSSDYEPVQEMRLAVVMYCGLSLAVYMYGVAQELLNLVRATPPNATTDALLWPDNELKGAGRVYRKLGRRLTGGAQVDNDNGTVRTRFGIDIISGTSPGAVNGVFLAKAPCNQETIDNLTTMWRRDVHFDTLLDETGQSDVVRSGDTLCELQYKAISTMQGDELRQQPAAGCTSPYVEELDLSITSTDVNGLTMPLKL